MGVSGARRVVQRIRSMAGVENTIGPVLLAAGELLATTAQISITKGSSSGTSGGKHQHIPSLPGEPPNNFSGFLAGHIEVTQPSLTLVRVTSEAPYSAALEWGTSKMEARPFMGPARNKTAPQAKAMIANAIRKHNKGVR